MNFRSGSSSSSSKFYFACIFILPFSCLGTLFNWLSDDVVDEQHRLHYPHCMFVQWKSLPAVAELLEEGLNVDDVMKAYTKSVSKLDKELIRQELVPSRIGDRSDPLCCVCKINYSNVLFMNCRHLICCFECSVLLSKCPLCRAAINYKIPVFSN